MRDNFNEIIQSNYDICLKILFSLILWLVSFRMYMCEYLVILLHEYVNDITCLSHVRFSFIFFFNIEVNIIIR